MTRVEFKPSLVFFQFEPCDYIERCGKQALYPTRHPFAPEHKKIFARHLCTSCWFHLRKLSGGRACQYPGCHRFIVPMRINKGVVPGRFLHNGRGLCQRCWHKAFTDGTLEQFEGGGWQGNVNTVKRDEKIRRLAGQGCSKKRIASAVGTSLPVVYRVLSQNSTSQESSASPAA